jgi:hypothetical protein
MNEDGELQQMIANLRQEIEEIVAAKQQMAAANQDQVQHLTGTIHAMRDQMERMQAGKQDSIQEAVADANQEVNQLKAAILAMREEMEKMHFDKQRAIHRTDDELRCSSRPSRASIRKRRKSSAPYWTA